jgi:hypothetical protein
LYSNTGNGIGQRNYNFYPASISLSVTIGDEYYIRVYPYDTSRKGTYQIAISESNIPPAITLPTEDINLLTENTWFDGEIVSSIGKQWFSFTASSNTQYVHFNYYTSSHPNLGIKLYNDNGVMIYSRSVYVGNIDSISLTNGNIYYFEVWGDNGTNSTYQVSFNMTSTPPSLP